MSLHVDGNKIKDASGNTVYLRGANYFHMKNDHTGQWLTSSGDVVGNYFDWETRVKPAIIENFDVMARYKLNLFRIHTCAQDWLQTPDYAARMKELASLAQARGIYVIFDIYDISNTTYGQPQMPYPPYSIAGDELILPDEQAFIDLWALIANAMKGSPNVIFELFNEPVGLWDAWMNTCQKCIARIRQITTTPIIIQWYWQASKWMNMKIYADDARTQGVNIIIGTHTYSDSTVDANNQSVNTIEGLQNFMLESGIADVATRRPILCTELGGVFGSSFQMIWLSNIIDVFYAAGVGFTAWVWNQYSHVEGLLTGLANFTFTEKGTIITLKSLSYSPITPPLFPCPFCALEFATELELANHITLVHPQIVYVCPHCGAQFSTPEELVAHLVSVHPPAKPSGCFIATACYGSPTHMRVCELRAIKNGLVARSTMAQWLYRLYYVFSPSIANLIREREDLKKPVRKVIEWWMKANV